MSVIYGLRAKDSDQYFYIGSTRHTANRRLSGHLSAIRHGTKRNRHFVNKANKVGLDNIVVDVLEETTREQQFEREKWWIQDMLAQGVNLVNRVYVDIHPPHKEEQPPLTEEKWLQALQFYVDYKQGRKGHAKNPEDEGIYQALSSALFLIIDQKIGLNDNSVPFD